jgi:hypothetical protein
MTADQLALDELHPCPGCNGTGCRACQHTGQVTYDPTDDSIPFGTYDAVRKDAA